MTTEVRTAIDLGDIAGIEIECRDCGAKVLYPAGEKNREHVQRQCPNCGIMLFAGDAPGQQPVAIEQLKTLMRLLRLLSAPATEEHAKVRIQVKPISQK